MDMVEQVTQALRAAGKDSSYYEFMRDHYPVGWVMDMGLQLDGDELEAEASGMVFFELTRDGPDEWSGLPGCGTVTTDQMFIYIRDRKKSEYTFVCLSPDDEDLPCPIAVKRERVERGVEAEPIHFFSINEIIDLEEEQQQSSSAAEQQSGPALKVRFSLALPAHLLAASVPTSPASEPVPAAVGSSSISVALSVNKGVVSMALGLRGRRSPIVAATAASSVPAAPVVAAPADADAATPPAADTYVLADDPLKPGLCFFSKNVEGDPKKQCYAVVFGNGWWSGFENNYPWHPCPDEQVAAAALEPMPNTTPTPALDHVLARRPEDRDRRCHPGGRARLHPSGGIPLREELDCWLDPLRRVPPPAANTRPQDLQQPPPAALDGRRSRRLPRAGTPPHMHISPRPGQHRRPNRTEPNYLPGVEW